MIRRMTSLDVPRIMEIWLNATIQGHPFIAEEYWYSNYETVKNVWLPAADTYVDMRGNEMLGFVSVHSGNAIGALFVDFEHQGIGIGTALINHIKAIYEALTLEVYKENLTALRFYKRKGFVVTEEKPSDNAGLMLVVMSWPGGDVSAGKPPRL